MNNELERILGEAADGASRRAGALPIDTLRGRGVRRRRTRQAGFSAMGVAAAFGLAFGAAQILPDGGTVGPAGTPTVNLPTADASIPLGACGSNVANMPTIDAQYWLRLNPRDLRAGYGETAPLTMTIENYGTALEVTETSVVYLAVAQDDVVVGFSWRSGDESVPPVAPEESLDLDGFDRLVLCEEGELVPTGNTGTREALPAGEYTTFAMLGRTDGDPAAEWAFDIVGDHGSLTILPEGVEPTEPGSDALGAVDVALPVCGESTAGFAFPEGVHIDAAWPLEVTVGHTGEDESGEPFFYTDGYGDQLRVAMTTSNSFEDFDRGTVTDARTVVVRDGVVVAELTWEDWLPSSVAPAPLRESLQIIETFDWVECTDGEHSQVPKGDYEILGWQDVEWLRADGSTVSTTLAYAPIGFTAYDFEDADNPGPSND
ncbi:MAG: hypothetical protein M3Y20_03020 [Actinomycetota bacterium]|nr:hypothetical protein [Actinomycetota bacterium]